MYKSIKIKIMTFILCFRDSISDSMTNLSSGAKEIILRSLASLNNLRTTTDVPAPAGIIDEITIIESKIFQPSLKKSLFLASEKKL